MSEPTRNSQHAQYERGLLWLKEEQRRALGLEEDEVYQFTCAPSLLIQRTVSRTAFQRLLEQGWTDAVRALHPEAPMYTFWDYKRERWARDAGLRLDFLLLNPVAAERLVDAGVDKAVRDAEGAGDHAPAWVVLR